MPRLVHCKAALVAGLAFCLSLPLALDQAFGQSRRGGSGFSIGGSSGGSRHGGSRSGGDRHSGGRRSGGHSGSSIFGGGSSGGGIFGGVNPSGGHYGGSHYGEGHHGEGGHSGPNAVDIINGVIGIGNAINDATQPHYPPPHHVQPPPVYVQPSPNYVRPQPQPRPQPAVAPPPNVIDKPAEVKKNDDFELVGRPLTPEVLAAWKNQTKSQVDTVLDAIGNLIQAADADAQAAMNDVTDKAGTGALGVEDLKALAAKMQPGIQPGAARRANRMFNRLAVLSRLVALLNTAVPGGGPIPQGNQVPIVLVPNLPRGTIIVLGNGGVIVGVGNLRQFVAVGRGNVAQCAGMTVAIGAPLPETDSKPTTSGALLINAEQTAVNYNVNSNAYSMEPEYRQPLPGGRKWVVAFDRGGEFGEARYGISKGTYKFTLTDEGWNLFKHTFDVTIDNSENPFEFLYVLDNKNQKVAAGKVQQHKSEYPPVVRFDDGQGATRAKRVESGLYKVAVTQENTLDLFGEDAVAPPEIASANLPATGDGTNPPAAPTGTDSSTDGLAPFTGGAGGAPGMSLFGDQGDWRPSLFVSDVPEVAYFKET